MTVPITVLFYDLWWPGNEHPRFTSITQGRRKEMKSEEAKWRAPRNLINIHDFLCLKTVVYTYAHGGAAHAAVETNGGLQTDANFRPISVIRRAIMIAAEQQWNCMSLIGRRWVVKIMNINNLTSEKCSGHGRPSRCGSDVYVTAVYAMVSVLYMSY